MKSMRPITEFLPNEPGSWPCSYSISPINNHTPDVPHNPPAPDVPHNPPAPVRPYDPLAPDVPGTNQPGSDLPYVITGGSGRVGKTIARGLNFGLLVSSIMLNGVGATAAAGNTNVVALQQAFAIKPSSAGGWKPPPALLPKFDLGHLNALHVLQQNMNSNKGTGNANNGRRGNLRSVKKAKKPAVVHEISAKTVDAPISRRQEAWGMR
uniref:Oxidoreductase n=1 Tax=Globodera pallida TaxID=36090 RepID=A0A183CAG6_GLOPA